METITVQESQVQCDGGKKSGHPAVFLVIDPSSQQVVCPYCSRRFVLSHQSDDSSS